MTVDLKKKPSPPSSSLPAAFSESPADAYRLWGYLQADLDPLGRLQPSTNAALEAAGADESPELAAIRKAYTGSLAVEMAHIPDAERRRWIAERMEGEAPEPDRQRILQALVEGETFEQWLQARYLGSKRFSIEGVTALLPFLDESLLAAAGHDADQAVLAMSHRGRLNVMLHIVGRTPEELLAGFEDVEPRSVLGSGDVKYHLGATGEYPLEGRDAGLRIHLASNPSHLEAVDPVALGRVRAKITRLQAEAGAGDDAWRQVLPVIMHGDAAFAGQGILAESLNFADLPGFGVGGAVHVVVNNWIGFTTEPRALWSWRFSTDVAKRLPVPIFHVNEEDPEAVVRAARLAVDYRYAFGSDVIVDLIGYRRHGHSEVDDPTITQPVLYAKLAERPRLWELYAESLGKAEEAEAEAKRYKEELDEAQSRASEMANRPKIAQSPPYWSRFEGGRYNPRYEVPTGISEEEIGRLGERLTTAPEGFNVHPKVAKLLEGRAKMAAGEQLVDYGMAEALAFASLVAGVGEGASSKVPVRLSGQDSRRATFAQRHAVLVDVETTEEHLPLQHIEEGQARFEIYDSMLSEAAVLGYEYGFSRDYPEALVLWEAQFGDFVNGAQIIIDQFISAAEDKWGLLSGIVMLLPHGYEGQGPEHSSARIERFLQSAAEDNLQIAQPSTAAQYFHLLRRQALRRWRKPLVVFTPKSMLRAKEASSELSAFTRDRFLNVMPDRQIEEAGKVSRVLVATGKILHELRKERASQEAGDTAILGLEQLYPFPGGELRTELDRLGFDGIREVIWVQEEPANMGALPFVVPILRRLLPAKTLRTIARSESASPATGSPKAHQVEQKRLLERAFETRGA